MSEPGTVSPDKLYYSIGEVAQMFGVTTSLIRFWETEFPNLRPRKNAKGDRRYTKKEIEELKVVYSLVKEKGFTLQGAKDHLKNKGTQKNAETIETLSRLKQFLLEIREKLPE